MINNDLIIDAKTLVEILKVQGLKTPCVIDIQIDESDINLKTLVFNVTATIDSSLLNVKWVVLELQKSLYFKICSLVDQETAIVNIYVILKENQNESIQTNA